MQEVRIDVPSTVNPTDRKSYKFAEAQSCLKELNKHIAKSRRLLSGFPLNRQTKDIIHEIIDRVQAESKQDIKRVNERNLGFGWTLIMGRNAAEIKMLQGKFALQRLETNNLNMQKIYTLLEQADADMLYTLLDQADIQMKHSLLEQADPETVHDLFERVDIQMKHSLLEQADPDTLHTLLEQADLQTKQSLLKQADLQTKQSLLEQADSETIHDLFEQGYITSIISSSAKSDEKITQALELLGQADLETTQELSKQGHLTAMNAALKNSGRKVIQAFELLDQGDTDEMRKFLGQSNERFHISLERSNEETIDELLEQTDIQTKQSLLRQADPDTLHVLLDQAETQTKRSLLQQVDIQTTNALLDQIDMQTTNALSDKVTVILDFLKKNDIDKLLGIPPVLDASIASEKEKYLSPSLDDQSPTDTSPTHMEHVVKDSVDVKPSLTDKPLTQTVRQIRRYAGAFGWIDTMIEHNHTPNQRLLDEIDAVSSQNLAPEFEKEVNESLAKVAPLLGQHPVDLLKPDFTSLQAASEEFSECFLRCTPFIKDMFQNMSGDSIRSDVERETELFSMSKFGHKPQEYKWRMLDCSSNEVDEAMAKADDATKDALDSFDRAINSFKKKIAYKSTREYIRGKIVPYLEDQEVNGQDNMEDLSRSAQRYMGEIQNIKMKLDTLRNLYTLDRVWKELTEVGQKIKPSTNPSELRDNIKSCLEIADRGYYEMRDKVTACEGPLLKIREVCNQWLKALESDAHANHKSALDKAKTEFVHNMTDYEQKILDFAHISVEEVKAQRGILYARAFQHTRASSRAIDRLRTHEIAVKPSSAESLNTEITSDDPNTMHLSTQIGDTTYQSSLRQLGQREAEMTFVENVTSTNKGKEPGGPDGAALTSSDILKHHAELILVKVRDADLKITTKIDDQAAVALYVPEAQQSKVEYSRNDSEFDSLLEELPEGRALNALLEDHPDKQINKIEIATRIDGNNTEVELTWHFGKNNRYYDKLAATIEFDNIKADYAIKAMKDLAEEYDHSRWHDRIDREIWPPDVSFWHDNSSDSLDLEGDTDYEEQRVVGLSGSITPHSELWDEQNNLQIATEELQSATETHVAIFKNDVKKSLDRLQQALLKVATLERHPFDRDLRLYHLKKTLDAMEEVKFPRVPLDLPTNSQQLQQLNEDLDRLGQGSFYKRELMSQQDLNPQHDQEIQHSPLDKREKRLLKLFPRVRESQTNLVNECERLTSQLTEAASIATNWDMHPYTREFFIRHIIKLTDATDTMMTNLSTLSPDLPTNREERHQLWKEFVNRELRSDSLYKRALSEPETRYTWLKNDPEKRLQENPELRTLQINDAARESYLEVDPIVDRQQDLLIELDKTRPRSAHGFHTNLLDLQQALSGPSIENWAHTQWGAIEAHIDSKEPSEQDLARQEYLRKLRELQISPEKRRPSI